MTRAKQILFVVAAAIGALQLGCDDEGGAAPAGASSTGGASTGAMSGGSTGTTGTAGSTGEGGSNPGPPSNFEDRCNAAGVVRCVGFDSPAEIAGTYGDPSGSLPGDATPEIDTSIKASGAGSLRFTIPSNSGSDTSGSYFTNFADDHSVQFSENAEFFVQWRQRFSAEHLANFYVGGGGWKHAIVGTGDKPGCTSSTSANGLCYASCTSLEVVTQNTGQRGFAQMYNSCSGSTSHGPYAPFEESFGSYDFKLQNARPDPFCLYSQGMTDPPSYFPRDGNCLGYVADAWMNDHERYVPAADMGNAQGSYVAPLISAVGDCPPVSVFTSHVLDLATRQWLTSTNEIPSNARYYGFFMTAYDPKRKVIWALSEGAPSHIGKLDVTTKTWSSVPHQSNSYVSASAASTGGYCPTHDVCVFATTNGRRTWWIWDPVGGPRQDLSRLHKSTRSNACAYDAKSPWPPKKQSSTGRATSSSCPRLASTPHPTTRAPRSPRTPLGRCG